MKHFADSSIWFRTLSASRCPFFNPHQPPQEVLFSLILYEAVCCTHNRTYVRASRAHEMQIGKQSYSLQITRLNLLVQKVNIAFMSRHAIVFRSGNSNYHIQYYEKEGLSQQNKSIVLNGNLLRLVAQILQNRSCFRKFSNNQ